MDWWLILVIIFASIMAAMATGLPVAFAFMVLNIIGLYIVTGGIVGLKLLPGAIYTSVATFPLLALPMFFLLGELLFHSGVFGMVMDVTDKWIGKVRARLLFVALGSGTIMAALSGAGMADTALLGSTIYPEVERRGYDRRLALGVITSSGLLAVLIPPSGLAVLLGSLAEVSIAGLLIGGIGPGFLMVFFYFWYILIRVRLNPSLAPTYEQEAPPLVEKVKATIYLTPLLLIIVAVVGFILLGVATPSEAAATGAVSRCHRYGYLPAPDLDSAEEVVPGGRKDHCYGAAHHQRRRVLRAVAGHDRRGQGLHGVPRRSAGGPDCHSHHYSSGHSRPWLFHRRHFHHADHHPRADAGGEGLWLGPNLVLDSLPRQHDHRLGVATLRAGAVRSEGRGAATRDHGRHLPGPDTVCDHGLGGGPRHHLCAVDRDVSAQPDTIAGPRPHLFWVFWPQVEGRQGRR